MHFVLFLFLSIFSAFAANPNTAHPHTGKATKFTNPPKAELTAAEKQTLSIGKAVMKQIKKESGGRGIAIFDVDATPEVVWSVITSFSSYPKWIDELAKSEKYDTKGEQIYVDFVISTWGVNVQYYVNHTYRPQDGYMTWTLDYTRESDLDDSTGYWLVYPSPLDPTKTRVEYTVDLRVSGWVPGFIQTAMAETGVENATKWVKREAEKK